MVRGLVQDQQIDLFIHQHTQPQPGLLAAGEGSHGLEHILTGEQKLAQAVTGDLWGAVFLIEHGIVKTPLRMGEFDNLRQISPFDRGTELNLTGAVLFSQQTLEEGGLAGTVVTQNGDPLAAFYLQLHIFKEGPVSEGFADVLHLKDHIAGKFLLTEGCPHSLFRLGLFSFSDSLHPVLDGHCPTVQGPVVDAPALHSLHRIAQLLQLRLFLLVLLHLQIEPGLLFIHVERVITGIEFSVTVHDLNDPLCDPVNKIPVMGNGQHGALEGIDIAFQPLHAVQIQMVRGLVQQQNVRLFQQQTGKVHSGLFTAGKGIKILDPLICRNAQTVADLVHFHIHFISAAGLESVYQIVILPELLFGCTLGHGRFQDFHLPLGCHHRRIGRAQHIFNGVAFRKTGNLGNQSDPLIGIDVNFAVVIVHFTGEDLQKRGLAAAVAAQNGHTLPFLDFKGQSLQKVFTDCEKFR